VLPNAAALALARASESLTVLDQTQREALAIPYLFFKSGYIPRRLAAFGVIVSAWAAACTLAFIISPDFAKHVNLWWFDTGLGLFELATGFWLVIKGLRPEKTTAERARAGITA
jgi:hypothetical protein